jgi:hypothetical protein
MNRVKLAAREDTCKPVPALRNQTSMRSRKPRMLQAGQTEDGRECKVRLHGFFQSAGEQAVEEESRIVPESSSGAHSRCLNACRK